MIAHAIFCGIFFQIYNYKYFYIPLWLLKNTTQHSNYAISELGRIVWAFKIVLSQEICGSDTMKNTGNNLKVCRLKNNFKLHQLKYLFYRTIVCQKLISSIRLSVLETRTDQSIQPNDNGLKGGVSKNVSPRDFVGP